VLNPSKIIIIKKISIAPIIKTESGKKIAGNVLDEYELLPKETVMGINGLISWWRFEGNANDEKGINNGTIISNVQFVDSKDGLGKTASFDGNGSWDGKGSHILIGYVSNENKLKINKDMTAGIWFKRNTPAVEGGKTLGLLGNWKWSTNVNEQSGWRFAFYNGRSNLDFTIVTKNDAGNIESDTATYDINSIGLNEWHYATGVFNSSAQKAYLYVDGTLKGTSGSTQSTIVTDNAAGIYPLRIGYNPINNGYFNGSIDEVMIFNRALSTTEISSLYTLG
ncbi:MAG: LamG domain-containing protein, partial [Nanoarchaeota archaeon]|nr:LamG domain-containing protein [Nanoarchaeota archaeon]